MYNENDKVKITLKSNPLLIFWRELLRSEKILGEMKFIKVLFGQKCYLLSHIGNFIKLPFLALCGLFLPFFGLVWPCMIFCGFACSCVAKYLQYWCFISPFLAVTDSHSFGFVMNEYERMNTDSTKINRPGHNIHMYWSNFWQPTAHLQQNIFGKTPIEVCSPHLSTFFGTSYTKIGQLFET